ncbi:DUF4253 domain-containing protein [Streptomyces sp. CA-111067]|uniref:DUF4253 domain-containing protein n=1 Tax=Streptomyces sp. CA-111067 TaxID=3240046 RepID=UPI003D9866A5
MAMLPNPLPRLADDPTGAAQGLRLPPGRLFDGTPDGSGPEPLLWYADQSAGPNAWSELLAARAAGLLPVLIEDGEQSADFQSPRFADWSLRPDLMSYPGDHDAEEVLAETWTGYTDDEDYEEEDLLELLDPYDQEWPGLAPAPDFDADPDETAAEVAAELLATGWLDNPHAALVHARRSADIPAAVGWTGPVNHTGDVGPLCAVLRSWEDRFGIRVVALGFDTLTVTVAAPPATEEEAEALAAEHFGFCPDNITQGNHRTLREYAHKRLLGRTTWHFWWD